MQICPDGKYRWYYEFPMLKNPVILYTIWKIMVIVAIIPAIVVLLSTKGFLEAFKEFFIVFLITFGIMFVLSIIGYFILATVYGFKYIVLFEMDEKGITHAQQEKQFTKAQAIGLLAVLAGIAKNDVGMAGTGILSSSKKSMTSQFKNVETVIGIRSKNTIKVNQLFAKNQIYVNDEDYDFVWEYITSRCVKAKIK